VLHIGVKGSARLIRFLQPQKTKQHLLSSLIRDVSKKGSPISIQTRVLSLKYPKAYEVLKMAIQAETLKK